MFNTLAEAHCKAMPVSQLMTWSDMMDPMTKASMAHVDKHKTQGTRRTQTHFQPNNRQNNNDLPQTEAEHDTGDSNHTQNNNASSHSGAPMHHPHTS